MFRNRLTLSSGMVCALGAWLLALSPAQALRPDAARPPARPVDVARPAVVSKLAPAQAPLVRAAEKAGLAMAWDFERGVPQSVRGIDLGARGAYSAGRGLAVSGKGRFAEDAVAVMDNLSGLFRIADAAQEFSARKARGDDLGFSHVRLQQAYRGLPVVGGEVLVHFNRAGRAYQVNGRYVPDLALNPAPALDGARALALAQADLRARQKPAGALAGAPALVVHARGHTPRLAYALTLIYRDARAGAGRWRYWIDARSGAVIERFNDIPSVPAPTASGHHSELSGAVLAGEGGGVTNVTGWFENSQTNYFLYNTNAHWIVENVAASGYADANTYAYRATTNWAATDRAEVSAARAFDLTQRYYSQVHGLNSFDGLGLLARANVHEGTSYVNAYWDGTEFYFGDGDGATANSLVVLDVAGHEFTHAVTEYSANLVYADEPGALNESFSDVFGTCIEFFGQADDRASYPVRNAGQADWLCGEDCWLSSTALRDLRNPANPATVGAGHEQPSRYQGTYWDFAQEVHQNSGVQNFFFYLLCEGGSGNNDGIAYSVTGIGITNAERVAYRALTVYCTPDTGYREVRGAWLSAALDLNPAWVVPVGAAWDAVGVAAVSVSPSTGAAFSGSEGGPFQPASFVFTINNADAAACGWGVIHTQSWIAVAPANGSLPALGSQAVTVTVAGAASALAAGLYVDALDFTNTSSAAVETRAVTLQVLPPAIDCFPLDSDPGWTTEGEWAFGTPAGLGGDFHGNPDPTAGASGANVYGVNLSGDYSTTPGGPYYLTAGPFDLSAYTNVNLSFQRWLNTDYPPWADATIQVSSDGTTWSQVWTNSATTGTADSSWNLFAIDLKEFADRQSAFYVRWGYQIRGSALDPAFAYSGWNLDDICFRGQQVDTLRISPGSAFASSGYEGGPFAPTSATYLVTNGGLDPIPWTASATSAWFSVSTTGGVLAVGATATVAVALNPAANALAPDLYQGAVTFSNETSGFAVPRAVSLTVRAIPGEIAVSDSIAPAADLALPYGDVIVGLSRTESITITNSDPVYPIVLTQIAVTGSVFSVTNGPAGFPFAVAVHSAITFQVSYTPTALVTNQGEVVIANNDMDEPAVHVALSGRGMPDYLQVSPAAGLVSRGHPGGPFTPDRSVYVLSNYSGGAISWTASCAQAWVTLSRTGGSLGAGAVQSVTVSVNAAANALGEGVHSDAVVFSNLTTGIGQSRPVALTVFTSPLIGVAPRELWVTNTIGQSQTNLLDISNGALADASLTFHLTSRSTGQAPLPFRAGAAAGRTKPVRDFSKAEPGVEFVGGELLVRFAEGVEGAARVALLAALGGGEVQRTYPLVPGLALVRLPPAVAVADALVRFNGAAGVLYAEPNYIVHAFATLPDDIRFGELWGMHNTGQSGGTPGADIDAPEAWEVQTGSTNIIVCVIDTGIDYAHEDLAANMWRNPGEIPGNLVDDDFNGYVDDVYGINSITGSGDPMDDHDHGTHCSGTIGGVGSNGVGVAGVNWRVRLMGAKFLDAGGSGDTADAITCVNYAAGKGAKVLSNSWGGGGYSQAMQDAINAAATSNILFIAAAGNSSSDTDVTPNYPSCYTSVNVVAVMSTDHNDQRSGFSSYGQSTVDLAAPGSSILSCRRGGGYQLMSGTSMATPHVAGAAALLLAGHPLATPAEVKQALMSSVDVRFPTLCASGGRMNLARAQVAMNLPWLTLDPAAATNLPAGSATNVQVGFHAGDLDPAIYHGEIVVSANDVTNPVVIVPVHMTILRDDLIVTPSLVVTSAGLVGGPFAPAVSVYTVSNAGLASVAWSLLQTDAWLTVSSGGGTLAPADAVAVTATVNAVANGLPAGVYTGRLSFLDSASGVTQRRAVVLDARAPVPDFFTELFNAADNDTDHMSLTFTPNGSLGFYDVCRTAGVTNFPTDPAGGDALTLDDDEYAGIFFTGGLTVPFYGTNRASLFVGSNGYLTFDAGNTAYAESLSNHFSHVGIVALFDDLDPSSGGSISWRQLADRVAVTYEGVPEYGSATSTNSFQFELFTNGVVRITWLDISAVDGLAGLSSGGGLRPGFVESDLTGYGICGTGTPPALAPPGNRVGLVSNLLSFTVTATPTEGDPVTLTLADQPADALLASTNGNGTFSWLPPVSGVYTMSVVAADSDGSTSAPFTVTVQGLYAVRGTPVITADPPGQNAAGDAFDLSEQGGAALTVDQGGFGSFGRVYVNYDATNLYLGGHGMNLPFEENAAILFLSIGTLTDDRTNLWDNSGLPQGLDFLHNLGFASPVPDIAIVLGDENGDGTFPSFNLGNGYDMGQGVFYLAPPGFASVPGARLSQFDGTGTNATVGADDDANRATKRWECSIPWAALNAAGMHQVSTCHVSGVIVSSSTNGADRYLSGNVLACDISPPSSGNYGFGFVTLTPIPVWLGVVDSDGDTLPDEWEFQNFLSLTGAQAGVDSDGDGFDNGAELQLGTQPTNSASGLLVKSVVGSNGQVRVTWLSVGGRSYQLEVSESAPFAFHDFTNAIEDDVAAGVESTESLIDPASTNRTRIYRLRLEP